jgi:phosphoribosyl 1,2-cyclic phosphate phosphodiesterase
VKLQILGCGTSAGVPRIGNDWGACDPIEPRNRRSRASILIETKGKRLLVDCGPDMREQLLKTNVDRIDGVIVTHDHADHCHGIDDLRALAQILGNPVPLYARASVLEQLAARFSYIFRGTTFYNAVAQPVALDSELTFGGATLRFVDQPHGKITSLGMRIEEGGRSAIYAIDFNDLTGEMRKLYQGADVWIADCLSRRPHPTHTHLDAVLVWAEEMGVGKLYLSHMNNSMDYQTLVAELPEWAAPAHDGLEIELR